MEALALFQQALTAFQELNDLRGEADSLKNIGDIETNRNQFAEALRTQQESLAFYRRLGDEDGEARTLVNIGTAVDGEGRHDDALVYLGQALPLFVAVETVTAKPSLMSKSASFSSMLSIMQRRCRRFGTR